MDQKRNNRINREKNVVATFIISAVVIALFLVNFVWVGNVIKARSVRRMEEGVATVINEVVSKLSRDSRILNAAADIISSADILDDEAVLESMESIAPIMETMNIYVLLPDNRVLRPEGSILDGAGNLDFDTEAPLGEHVSSRVVSVSDETTFVLRHFVPIVQDGQVAALLYGRTRLEDLPKRMNIDNIYNASADVYIIDAENGELLMDTRHKGLGELDDFSVQGVRGGANWEDIKQALLDLESGYGIIRTNNQWNYFYYTPAGINQWEIVVSVPEREALSSMYAMQKIFYLTGSCILFSIILYFRWTQRSAKKAVKEAVERAVLEEKLQKAEAAERAKTVFLSNMSHDIRTPMNAIIGFATLAKNNIDSKERVEQYMSKILSSGNYLLSLINDVLDMSRIESGKLSIEEKPCAISEIFLDMRNMIQTQMRSKQLKFFMDTENVVDEEIYCDKVHVNQILLNLLSNAMKFTPAGGSVYLTIRQMPTAPAGCGTYEICVRDTGIGMSEEFVQHIFEPFERERTSTVSGIQGTGLGMAITKNIVDAMGGTIRVETKEGQGTEFVIRLDFRLQSEHRQAEAIPELTGMRALVVDDNFSTCDSVSRMLTELGLQAAWTLYGREAVARARQAAEMKEAFDVYIVDWALPDLSGLEVVRQVRSIVGQEVPIIIMTAYEWGDIEAEARQAGVTAFCSKPLFLSDLRSVLETGARGQETSEEALPAPEEKTELNGKRLLLVEDNELNREIAEELLIENGYTVESVEDGTEAVEKMKTTAQGWYDLILMDIQMPIMNGYEATKAIRALDDPARASIPIVAMTANAFEEDRQYAFECGMNEYLPKPINIEELLKVLHRFLDV